MKKIEVILIINDYKITDIGILENDIIRIKENKVSLEYNLKNNILIRENNEMKQVIDFNNKKFLYKLKQISNEFSQNFDVISLTNCDKQVNIIYRIESSYFHLNLKYETI